MNQRTLTAASAASRKMILRTQQATTAQRTTAAIVPAGRRFLTSQTTAASAAYRRQRPSSSSSGAQQLLRHPSATRRTRMSSSSGLLASACRRNNRAARRLQLRQQKSTASLEFAHSFPGAGGGVLHSKGRPSYQALRTLFVASAIPMVGFGFMDNFVMIQAGQYIDSTLGVQLGLATMTAAAAGQVVSDVSGVVFGGTLERFLTRASLIKSPNLTTFQRQLPICRNVAMAGAVVGVIFGCALGATTLLLVDLEARDRIQRATTLRELCDDMIAGEHLPCAHCTIYIAGSSKDYTFSNDETKQDLNHHGKSHLKFLSDADSNDVEESIRQGTTIRSADGRTLYAPVSKQQSDDSKVLAVVALQCNEGDVPYTEEHLQTSRVIARHIAIFMDRLVE